MTALIDLVVPTYALLSTAGEESNTLFELDVRERAVPGRDRGPRRLHRSAKDIFDDPANTGSRSSRPHSSRSSDSLVTKVLTSSDVAAALARLLRRRGGRGGDPVRRLGAQGRWPWERLPPRSSGRPSARSIVFAAGRSSSIVKVTHGRRDHLERRTQTDWPPRCVPDEGDHACTITAQYSDNTTRTVPWRPSIRRKGTSVRIDWRDIPVGGHVTFVVAHVLRPRAGASARDSRLTMLTTRSPRATRR